MHPTLLDDLLSLADHDGLVSRERTLAAAITREISPVLVFMALSDGTLCAAVEGSEIVCEYDAQRLALDSMLALINHDCVAWYPDSCHPRTVCAAMRLGISPASGLVGCVVKLPQGVEIDGNKSEVERLIGAALAIALLRERKGTGELSARVAQLNASQAALRTTYRRCLAEAVEEHRLRVQQQDLARQELQRAHTANQLILNSAGEGIIGLDVDGHATFVNPAAERWMGWNVADLSYRSVHEVLLKSHTCSGLDDPQPCPICRTLRHGKTNRVEQGEFWRKDGTSFPVSYAVTAILESEAIVGAVLTFQDISERRLLESQLLQAQKLESIGQLAAGIAHEINTPTQFVGDNLHFLMQAYADLRPLHDAAFRNVQEYSAHRRATTLRESNTTDDQLAEWQNLLQEIPKAISQSLEGVAHVGKIVRSMREFSHPGADDMRPLDVNKALESLVTVCRNEWKYVALVVMECDPNLPLVTCLPSAFNQAFLNLIVNAAHAVADKLGPAREPLGQIAISTRLDGEWVEICVRDTGIGIRPEHQARVFDPFFTTKAVGRGTGQGLAIARSVIVDRHGGTLTFRTSVGEGTTFVARLPVAGRQSRSEHRVGPRCPTEECHAPSPIC